MLKRRILIFSLVYYPRFIGGAEIAVKEITDRLSEHSFDMVVMRTEKIRIEKIGNVTIHRVGPYVGGKGFLNKLSFFISKHYYPIIAYFYAKKLHRKEPFARVWSIMASYAGFAALFFKLRFPKVPFILTLQEGDPIWHIKLRALPVYPLFKMIFSRADRIQAISNHLAEFGRSMGFSGEPVVIPNGVDVEHFTRRHEESSSLRVKLGHTHDDVVLITASRLVKKNGVGDIIYALSLLSEKYKLLILGTGRLERKLKLAASRRKLDARVKFIGFVPHGDLPKYLQASDIFIRPSRSEGLGNAFLEAMAAGIPVIATQVGGIPDFLKDGETGVFCEVRNPKSIKNAVFTLENRAKREKLIKNALELVMKKYSWNTIANDMSKVLG